jgi:hypothetical protein
MIRNRRLTVIAVVTAALGLGGTFAAFLAEQQKSPLAAEATTSAWDGSTRTAYSSSTVSYNGASYYVIDTAAELAYVATNSASWSKNFLVTADIDLGNKQWTSIALNNGVSSYNKTNKTIVAYSGIFDFNGHNVSNMSINGAYNSTSRYVTYLTLGLFGNNNGTIRNLNLKDATITVSANQSQAFVGGIVGYNGGTVESCTVSNLTETVTFHDPNYSSYYNRRNAAGSFVGFNGGTIKNCLYLSGSTTVHSDDEDYYDYYGYTNSTVTAGTVYGNSDSDSVVTNVYTDSTNVTTTIPDSVTNNSSTTEGDLSGGTITEAIETINTAIAEASTTEGNANVEVNNGTNLFGGETTTPTTTDTKATDLLAEFMLLHPCTDCDKVGTYWDAYNSDPAVKAAFDSYVITDPDGDYTAGSKLAYMHNYSLAKSGSASSVVTTLKSESSESQALLLVGAVTVALGVAGYFLLKKKAIA